MGSGAEKGVVTDPDRLAFWADRVRALTETETLTWEFAPSTVVRWSKLWRHFYSDPPHKEPTSHVAHLRAATPDMRHEWQRADPLITDEVRWPMFQTLANACDEDVLAVIDLPYRRVPAGSDWEWADEDLEIREYSADTTWEDVVDSSGEIGEIFGPFSHIDRMMVIGSSASWCLIYTEIPEVECWVTTADGAPHAVRDLLFETRAP